MTNDIDSLRFSKQIETSLDVVYRAFTNASCLREWLSDGASTLPKPGGRIMMWWNSGYFTAGEYLVLEPGHQIVFTWHGKAEPATTEVSVHLTPEGSGTKVVLIHSGIGSDVSWNDVRNEINRGWEKGLENLASILEVGKDLRIYNRPMLGITLSDFDADIAKKMQIPVSKGIRIGGTIDGMGAQASGLQADDVIVGMDGKTIEDFVTLLSALGEHKAGDRIPLTIYRGQQKMEMDLLLSGRPVPEIPKDQQALAEAVENIYNTAIRDIELAFADATEDEVKARPGPDEWSAIETLGHLILSERETLVQITDMLGGYERWADDFIGNTFPPLEALLSVYSTVPDLLAELKRYRQEVVTLLRGLPVEFVQRKSTFWRLSDGLLNFNIHIDSHIPQIKNAIAAART
jgi:uncharacterized protein YndB with AHSA1/START domain